VHQQSIYDEPEGWNQLWEQLFEVFEEKPPDLVRQTLGSKRIGWNMFSVPRQKLGMNDPDRYEEFNPGTQKLDVQFACASPACLCFVGAVQQHRQLRCHLQV
jgi:hypothetical protein